MNFMNHDVYYITTKYYYYYYINILYRNHEKCDKKNKKKHTF